MRFKLKEIKSYEREVLDEIQAELGRADIGVTTINEEFIITDINGNELTLTTGEEARIRALAKVKERLE